MRITILTLLAGLLLPAAQAATDSQSWEREFRFDGRTPPTLRVRNVWGEVVVRSHREDTIRVQAREVREAATEQDLATMAQHLWLDVVETESGLEMTIGDTDSKSRWWDRCRRCELHVDFEIWVPEDAHVDVATVMDGAVRVEGVSGPVRAHNVNGDVEVRDVIECVSFETVNGELSVAFAVVPDGPCNFETVNGDMTVRLPEGSGADLTLDLFNGRVRSDFEVAALATQPQVEKDTTAHGTRYKISQGMGLRVGPGGPAFRFESINGDVLIRRQLD